MLTRWMFITILSIFFLGSLFGAFKEFQFLKYGVTAQIDSIGDIYVSDRREGRYLKREGKSIYAAVSFTTTDGQAITVSRQIPQALLDALDQGEIPRIRYILSDPSATRFDGDSSMILMIVISLVSGLWLFWELKKIFPGTSEHGA